MLNTEEVGFHHRSPTPGVPGAEELTVTLAAPPPLPPPPVPPSTHDVFPEPSVPKTCPDTPADEGNVMIQLLAVALVEACITTPPDASPTRLTAPPLPAKTYDLKAYHNASACNPLVGGARSDLAIAGLNPLKYMSFGLI